MPVGRGGGERVGTEVAAGVNCGAVMTGHKDEAGGRLKTCIEGQRMGGVGGDVEAG